MRRTRWKKKPSPIRNSPSGMPGVQTLVPVMLDHVNKGRLSLERFVDLTSPWPRRAFSASREKGRIAEGYDADLTIVDLKKKRVITNKWIESRCGWTPYDGYEVTGWPQGTFVRGRKVMWEGQILGKAAGRPVEFLEALPALKDAPHDRQFPRHPDFQNRSGPDRFNS